MDKKVLDCRRLLARDLSVKDFLEDFLSEKTATTRHTYTGYLQTFVKWFSESDERMPETMEEIGDSICRYVNYKQGEKQNATSYCKNTGWCLNSMLRGHPYVFKSKCSSQKTKGDHAASQRLLGRRQLTSEEEERITEVLAELVRAHKNPTAAAFLLMLNSGLRFIELYTITAGALRRLAKLEPAVIRRKGNKDLPVAVTELGAEAAALMAEQLPPEMRDDQYVYADPNREPGDFYRQYNNTYNRMLNSFKKMDAMVNGKSEGVSLHSMRRSFADRLHSRSNNDYVLVAKVLGHSDFKNVLRYVGNDWNKTARRVAEIGNDV